MIYIYDVVFVTYLKIIKFIINQNLTNTTFTIINL